MSETDDRAGAQMVYIVTNRVGEPYAAFADHADAVASCVRRGVGRIVPMVVER